MTLWETAQEDAANVFLNTDGLAESAGYTPKGGAETTITALIERREVMEDISQPDGSMSVRYATVYADQDDVTDPQRGDQFSFAARRGGSAVTWVVDDYAGAGALWSLHVVRTDQQDMGAREFRADRT